MKNTFSYEWTINSVNSITLQIVSVTLKQTILPWQQVGTGFKGHTISESRAVIVSFDCYALKNIGKIGIKMGFEFMSPCG